MAANKRRLRRDFIDFLQRRDAMPKMYQVEDRLREIDQIKTGNIGRLFNREYLSPEVAAKFGVYVLDRGNENPGSQLFVAVRDFIRPLAGAEQLDQLSPHTIANYILEADDDALAYGVDRFLQFFNAPYSLRGAAMLCEDDEVEDAVNWMYIVAGRFFEEQADPERAEQIAQEMIGVSCSEYATRARAWLRFDPWTLVLSRRRNTSVGMSVVLPLKKKTYDAFRAGKIRSNDIEPSDMERPSPYILLDGIAERPIECDGPAANVTGNLHMTLMRQVSVLTHSRGPSAETPVHVITQGPSALSIHRLETAGFKRLKTCLPNTSIPIYERVTPWDRGDTRTYFLRALLDAMGMDADSALRPKPRYAKRKKWWRFEK